MTILPQVGPLFTDLYELTMAAGYFQHLRRKVASFSLFIRDFPPHRNYFIAAGIEAAVDELASLSFSQADLEYLEELRRFDDDFLAYLADFRFTGGLWALPEGTVCFANEPLLEVTAPVIEAQILETYLLNTIGFQTMIATKAARCVTAARGRTLIDFSLRRTQGHDAGLHVARCCYLAGFEGTSNVLAGRIYGIPVSGTMAHSFITAFESEIDAYLAFAETFPNQTVLLIDTYDTIQGAKNAVTAAGEMKKRAIELMGVRLDSGDIATLSRQVRSILDAAGLQEAKIFASSGYDEYKITDHLQKAAAIDAFGVGTKMGVSADAPYLDIVYKMVRFDGRDVRKLSPGKLTLAGEKQVFRSRDGSGFYQQDHIGRRDQSLAGSEPILIEMMRGGKRCQPAQSLATHRRRALENIAGLSDFYKTVTAERNYPVYITPELQRLQATVSQKGTEDPGTYPANSSR